MKIIHSRRKTIALIIERDGSLTIRAPLRTTRAQIEHLVQEKAEWIADKQALVQAQQPVIHKYAPGETFWFLGKNYPLEIETGPGSPGKPRGISWALVLSGGRFRLKAKFLTNAAQHFERWYREQARAIIAERAAALAHQHGYTYTSLRITGARSRWGSCGAGGRLNFTWRLIQAPVEIIDYVIVHELAHLVVRNHSSKFWERVRRHIPDYAQRRKWLRDHTRLMNDEL